MRSQLVLTLIGRDRPGLVERFPRRSRRHGGNWEESRMAHLAGKFAGILRVSVPANAASSLAQALSGLEREGLRILVESTEPRRKSPAVACDSSWSATIAPASCATSRARSPRAASTSTNCTHAARTRRWAVVRCSGRTHCCARRRRFAIDDLRAQLEGLADDLMVELSLDAVDERAR